MSNRQRPTRPVPFDGARRAPLPPRLHRVEWTDQPAATYTDATLWWIARSIDTARRMNVWECETCHAQVLCFDRHPGTTPMMVAHSTLGGGDCPGLCRSHFYDARSARHARDRLGGPSHEWYRPGKWELAREPRRVRDHVMQGGLLVREVPESERPTPPRNPLAGAGIEVTDMLVSDGTRTWFAPGGCAPADDDMGARA